MLQMIAAGNPPGFIYTGFQTAGRGQTGNGWESEKDKNLLCSILLPPCDEPFYLTVVTSIAVQRLIGENTTIKWPNDIYYQDRKLAGILIETAISGGKIKYAVAGIGLNVNQTSWHNAPNPVSIKQIEGKDGDIEDLMTRLMAEIQKALTMPKDEAWAYYKSHLYRRKGIWPFVEREVTTAPTMNAGYDESNRFLAQIEDILPSGEIVLLDSQGTRRKYHFKQIRYVL